jgi:hypothetical protein
LRKAGSAVKPDHELRRKPAPRARLRIEPGSECVGGSSGLIFDRRKYPTLRESIAILIEINAKFSVM